MSVRGTIRAGALVLLLMVLLPVLGGTAQAHTELAGSAPAAGAMIDTPPRSVDVSFSATLVPDLAEVVVRGADGADHVSGPVAVLGSRLSVPVSGMDQAGTYQVAYRVVSADGHPVTGEFDFRLTERAAAQAVAAGGTGGPKAAAVTGQGAGSTSLAAAGGWAVPALAAGSLGLVLAGRLWVAVRRARA